MNAPLPGTGAGPYIQPTSPPTPIQGYQGGPHNTFPPQQGWQGPAQSGPGPQNPQNHQGAQGKPGRGVVILAAVLGMVLGGVVVGAIITATRPTPEKETTATTQAVPASPPAATTAASPAAGPAATTQDKPGEDDIGGVAKDGVFTQTDGRYTMDYDESWSIGGSYGIPQFDVSTDWGVVASIDISSTLKENDMREPDDTIEIIIDRYVEVTQDPELGSSKVIDQGIKEIDGRKLGWYLVDSPTGGQTLIYKSMGPTYMVTARALCWTDEKAKECIDTTRPYLETLVAN